MQDRKKAALVGTCQSKGELFGERAAGAVLKERMAPGWKGAGNNANTKA